MTEKGFTQVSFESDSLQIILSLFSPLLDRSTIGQVVEDTKFMMSSINGDGFAHTRRNANSIADRITRFALHVGTSLTWFEEPLYFIVDLLFEDCNL